MNKKGIFLVLIVLAVGLLLAGCGAKEEPVSRTEYQQFQTKIEGDVTEIKGNVKTLSTVSSSLAGVVDKVVAKVDNQTDQLSKMQNQRDLDLAAIQSQIKIQGLEKKVEDVAKEKDTERQLSELKLQLAEVQKRVKYAYPLQQPYYPPPPTTGRYGTGLQGFWIDQPGRYEFIITPYYVEFFLDGQRVTNNQVIYLTRNSHNCWSNSEFSFRMNWIGY